MATTTPNYGWTVPTSTDLVKDGATAIETLGDAIDASMNTALGTKKAGMVLLNTTSFSAVSSQSITSVFSSTYDNYKIVLNASGTNGVYMRLRWRDSGGDKSSANYQNQWGGMGSNASWAASEYAAGTTSSMLINGTRHDYVIEVLRPNLATATSGFWQTAGQNIYFVGNVSYTGTEQLTGFSLIMDSGTTTGSVSVYGYNK